MGASASTFRYYMNTECKFLSCPSFEIIINKVLRLWSLIGNCTDIWKANEKPNTGTQ